MGSREDSVEEREVVANTSSCNRLVRHRTGEASLNVFPIYFHANFEFPFEFRFGLVAILVSVAVSVLFSSCCFSFRSRLKFHFNFVQLNWVICHCLSLVSFVVCSWWLKSVCWPALSVPLSLWLSISVGLSLSVCLPLWLSVCLSLCLAVSQRCVSN